MEIFSGADLLDSPQSSPCSFQSVSKSKRRKGVIRYSSTVSASLPVLDTVQSLIRSGDHVHRLVGSLSGTIGYVLDQVDSPNYFIIYFYDFIFVSLLKKKKRENFIVFLPHCCHLSCLLSLLILKCTYCYFFFFLNQNCFRLNKGSL